jgi:pyruvate ferredoxin oxidoreductase alpha subunit
MTRMLTGNAAAAWGARLADVDYVPAFPITPQTEIVEALAGWCAERAMPARFVMVDSEHSMLTAAGAAAATGARVFTATSSQGLLHGIELLYTVPGWRVPFVLVNVSRGLAAPITLETDHNDVLAARDSGCLQIHAETCQEVLDSVLIAYRIAEDRRVLLPVIVNLDGFTLSFTREPVEIPSAEDAAAYVGTYAPRHAYFRGGEPMAQGVAVLGGALYSHFRYQAHLAAENALVVHEEAAADFARRFGRHHGLVDGYRLDDADLVLIMSNSYATKGRAAVDRARAAGIALGVLRLRVVRPFPLEAIRRALAGRQAVAVIDQNLSIGAGGILVREIAHALYDASPRPRLLSYVGGLGGKDIGEAEFAHIVQDLQRAAATGEVPPPRLLMTEAEAAQVRGLIEIAGGNGAR